MLVMKTGGKGERRKRKHFVFMESFISSNCAELVFMQAFHCYEYIVEARYNLELADKDSYGRHIILKCIQFEKLLPQIG